MSELADSVTVRKHKTRGRVIVSVTDGIDEDALTAKAESHLLFSNDVDDDRVEKTKAHLAERAVEEAVKRNAPEAFDPRTPVSVRLKTDREMSLF